MIEHPIIGITIVVSIYWLDSVYVGWSTMSDDASLEQGGRWCITIRAATIAVILSLLAFIPIIWALVGSVAMIVMIICLERNGTSSSTNASGTPTDRHVLTHPGVLCRRAYPVSDARQTWGRA